MPPGSLETSFRSNASRAAAEILVVVAICRSEIPRRSRAGRSMPPKSPVGVTPFASDTDEAGVTLDKGGSRVKPMGDRDDQLVQARSLEERYRRDSRGTRGGDGFDPLEGHAADRNDGECRAPAGGRELGEPGNRVAGGLATGWEHSSEHEVIASTGGL